MFPRGAYKLANGEMSKGTWALVAGRRLSIAPSVIRKGWPERNGVVIGDLLADAVLRARCARPQQVNRQRAGWCKSGAGQSDAVPRAGSGRIVPVRLTVSPHRRGPGSRR